MVHASAPKAEERDGFRFRGGSLALDFTATLAGRLKPAPRDLIEEPGDLARWLVAAGLCLEPPKVSKRDCELAKALREAIYALVVARLRGRTLPAGFLATLNEVAATQAAVPQLGPNGNLTLVGPSASLLALIARDAIALLAGPESQRLRQCEAETCTLLFVDRSRKHDRRWCSMAGCGNKAKVDSFRRRQRETNSQQ